MYRKRRLESNNVCIRIRIQEWAIKLITVQISFEIGFTQTEFSIPLVR